MLQASCLSPCAEFVPYFLSRSPKSKSAAKAQLADVTYPMPLVQAQARPSPPADPQELQKKYDHLPPTQHPPGWKAAASQNRAGGEPVVSFRERFSGLYQRPSPPPVDRGRSPSPSGSRRPPPAADGRSTSASTRNAEGDDKMESLMRLKRQAEESHHRVLAAPSDRVPRPAARDDESMFSSKYAAEREEMERERHSNVARETGEDRRNIQSAEKSSFQDTDISGSAYLQVSLKIIACVPILPIL